MLNVNTVGELEGYPSIRGDGLELFLTRQNGSMARIHSATRSDTTNVFGIPSEHTELSMDNGTERDLEISSDGLELYVKFNLDLLVATRSSTGSSFGPFSNTNFVNPVSPKLCGDDLTIIYLNNPRQPTQRTRTSRSSPWSSEVPVSVPELNGGRYNDVAVRHDCLEIVFIAPLDLGLPNVATVSRESTSEPFGNFKEVAVLSQETVAANCDFGTPLELFCSLDDDGWDLYRLTRE